MALVTPESLLRHILVSEAVPAACPGCGRPGIWAVFRHTWEGAVQLTCSCGTKVTVEAAVLRAAALRGPLSDLREVMDRARVELPDDELHLPVPERWRQEARWRRAEHD